MPPDGAGPRVRYPCAMAGPEEPPRPAGPEHRASDPARCPLCGEPNACALASGGAPGAPCWCVGQTFPEDLLARVPQEARRRACICRRCVASATRAER